MFTGIVQAMGKIVSVKPFEVDAGKLDLRGVQVGDSICVQGACLTVTAKRARRLRFDVSRETLRMTAGLDLPGPVNLEKSLSLGDPLGGHIVSGHVDGVGTVLGRKKTVVRLKAPKSIARYIARKGSICIDGVSLTVNRTAGAIFEVNLIPLTLRLTTLGRLRRGAKVNVEVDPIARYVEIAITRLT